MRGRSFAKLKDKKNMKDEVNLGVLLERMIRDGTGICKFTQTCPLLVIMGVAGEFDINKNSADTHKGIIN